MNDQPIALSLIMATLGRTDPIIAFLDSIRDQSFSDVELVIVDQNDDDRVMRLLATRADTITVRHLHERPGLALARNTGAAAARGAILGFPDDDCTYPPGLIRRINGWFADHPDAHGLSCRVTDDHGRASAGGYMARDAHWITRSNVWRSITSCGLFVRQRVHHDIGGFDERLGLGAPTPWGSAEETDYVLQAIAQGFRIYYEPQMLVLHPRKAVPLNRASLRRAWRYGNGAGYVLRKHGYGPAAAAYFAALPLASAAKAMLRADVGRCADRIVTSAGRVLGWMRARRWNSASAAAGGDPALADTRQRIAPTSSSASIISSSVAK